MEQRIIKFKAKRLDNSKWVEGDLYHRVDKYFITYADEKSRTRVLVDPSTVCQFTGLKDKDGKDIFENDLLKDEQSGITSAIKWKKHTCCYVYEKPGAFETTRVFANHTCFLSVVGNKFDRKEE